MKGITLVWALLLWTVSLHAQTSFTKNGMSFTYEILDETITIKLKAPTKGWVGVGFNTQNQIVKSDLLLFRVKEGRTEGMDMHVVGFGNPKEDRELGGTTDFTHLKGIEQDGYTQVEFQLPFPSSDEYDFKHQLKQPFWLILAYSTHDDFGHHSRMRTHVEMTFVK